MTREPNLIFGILKNKLLSFSTMICIQLLKFLA